MNSTVPIKQEIPSIGLPEFLEEIPPGQLMRIIDISSKKFSKRYGMEINAILCPDIQLHCDNEACNGIRFFRCTDQDSPWLSENKFDYFYLNYICSNCQKTTKTFSLAAMVDKGAKSGQAYKFGELPNFGPPTPSRLIKLIGPDRELFLNGRRCENQGLGIGAFVYYRRVIENQKNRIFDEIIKVATVLNAKDPMIDTLNKARDETQFNKAMSSVKDAIPQTLLINGHNPITLLHSALSDGLHAKTDEHCLELATSIRVVLAELSERLSQALKDESEIKNALSKLLNINQQQ